MNNRQRHRSFHQRTGHLPAIRTDLIRGLFSSEPPTDHDFITGSGSNVLSPSDGLIGLSNVEVSDEDCNDIDLGNDLLGLFKGGGLSNDAVPNSCSDCDLHSPPSSSAVLRDWCLRRGLRLKNDVNGGEPKNPGDFFSSGDFIL